MGLLGKQVSWTFTDEKGKQAVVSGVVRREGLNWGRIEVVDSEGATHHVQPSWVAVKEN